MKLRGSSIGLVLLLMCSIGVAQRAPQRDSLGFLKRSLTDANEPALTAEQETQLNDLVKSFQQSQQQAPDESLQAARKAYDNAILAGDLAAAQTQAAIIGSRTAELSKARLQAESKFKIDALAVLKNGGQLDPLKQKFRDERVLRLVSSLIGGFGGGRPGFGGFFGPDGFGRPHPRIR